MKIRIRNSLAVTTEKLFPQPKPSPGETTENSYSQLTLDFSDTTENSDRGFSAVSPGGDRHSLNFTGAGDDLPDIVPGKLGQDTIYSVSATTADTNYRWFQPGKNDGNLYLGAVTSNKFLRFALVWENSKDTTEIFERWFNWFGRKD